ncbi:hypothetical protein V6N13_142551 [Hibiscus sabdariffa]|uniref:Uncharacterized protein n=2 Tax=Hibiscus sabdariffa TaxID=183260 RepID=A0ABR1ZCE8_9ROSI
MPSSYLFSSTDSLSWWLLQLVLLLKGGAKRSREACKSGECNAILAKRGVNSVVSEDRDYLIDSREETSEAAGTGRLGPLPTKKASSIASKTAKVPLSVVSDNGTLQSLEFAADDGEVCEQIRSKELIWFRVVSDIFEEYKIN